MTRLTLIISNFLFLITLSAQTGLKVAYLNPVDGLSNRCVFEVHRDMQGFLWIATLNGLNRYDGQEFKIFQHEKKELNTIPDSRCWAVSACANGEILLHLKTGYTVYNPINGQFRVYKIGEDRLPLEERDASLILRRNWIWLLPELQAYSKRDGAGDWAGYVCHDRKIDSQAVPIFTDAEVKLASIHQDSLLWIWNRNAVFHRLNIPQKKWERLSPFGRKNGRNIESGHPHLPIDKNGNFWFPNLDPNDNILFESFPLPDNINTKNWKDYIVDNKKNIWLNDKDKHLYRWEYATKKLDYFGKLGNELFVAHEDKEGIIWLARASGLVKIIKSKNLFDTYLNVPFSLDAPPAIDIHVDRMGTGENGKVYFFSQNRISGLKRQFYEINPTTKQGRPVELVHEDSTFTKRYPKASGIEFISNNGHLIRFFHEKPFGISQYDPITSTYSYDSIPGLKANQTLFRGSVSDGAQGWFIKINKEIYWFNNRTGIFSPIAETPKPRSELIYFHQEKNSLWVKDNNQLLVINRTAATVDTIPLTENSGPPSNMVAWKQFLWVGTNEGLLQINPKNNEITATYTTDNGLPDNAVCSILAEKEALWLGTGNAQGHGNGLCRYNPFTNNSKTYTVEDGLSNNEFIKKSVLKTADGQFWMGTVNGINAFFPEVLNKMITPENKLVWTKFSRFDTELNQEISQTIHSPTEFSTPQAEPNPIVLSPKISSFKLHFALTSLNAPKRHHYQWYLEGYEKTWQHKSNQPIAEYQQVKPGHYVFHAKASDHKNNAATNEIRIPIRIIAVWYQRWWAKSIALLVGLGLLFLLYRFQLNRKLEKAEIQRIKELDLFKSRLYTNITHEFRTPLTVILGMTEQLTDSNRSLFSQPILKDGWQQKLNLIRRNGQNLLTLINQLLDLSKLEARKMERELIAGDLIQFIKYLLESFHSLAGAKDINIHFSTEVNQLMMPYDADKIKKIISNLLSNAIKFTPENGHIYTYLSLKRDCLNIQIKDTGIGIEDNQIPYIFDRFYQTDASTTRKSEGSGIGLALVKELVQFLNGTITVNSKIGTGTIFLIELPITKGVELRDKRAPFSTKSNSSVTPTLFVHNSANKPVQPVQKPSKVVRITDASKDHLLLIEDNADIAEYIQSVLEKDYHISSAKNGKIGIEMALENIPDIIISDVMMPEKNGFSVVETLKKDERTSHIPIVLLTAKADIISKLTGLKSGADAYLPKPFVKEELLIRLDNLVQLRKQLQEKYSSIKVTAKVTDMLPTIEDFFLQKVNNHIQNNLDNSTFSVPDLCQLMTLSQSQLYRKIKALTKLSTVSYIRRYRLLQGKALLQNKALTISEIAYQVGFTSVKYFSDAFVKEFKQRPSTFRNS